MGSGLDSLRQKAPLLAQRWAFVRRLEGNECEESRMKVYDDLAGKPDLDWQDDLAIALMVMVFVLGVMGLGFAPNVLITTLNPLWQVANMVLALSGSAIVGLLAMQAALLLLVAAAFRLLTFVPVVSLVFGGVALFWWVSGIALIAPVLLLFLIIPSALITLLWIGFLEFGRCMAAKEQGEPAGTAMGGLLAVIGALSLFGFSLWQVGYFSMLSDLYVALHQDLDGIELGRRRDAFDIFLFLLAAALVVIFLIVSTVWIKKLMIACAADEKNSPVLCAATAIWSLLLDVSTLGILAYFSRETFVRDTKSDVPLGQNPPPAQGQGHSPGSRPSNPSSSQPEGPAKVRIGEHIQSGKYRKDNAVAPSQDRKR